MILSLQWDTSKEGVNIREFRSLDELEKFKKTWRWQAFQCFHIGDNAGMINSFLDLGYSVVHCDASYRDGIGTASIYIENTGRQYAIQKTTFRSKGPVYAEMMAMIHALRRIKQMKTIDRALLVNDNLYSVFLAAGCYTPRKDHIKAAVQNFNDEKAQVLFPVELGWVRSKITKKVDKAAKREMKSKEIEIRDKIEKRKEKVLQTIRKAKALNNFTVEDDSVKIRSEKSNRWYAISFSPIPTCTCAWWRNKWGNKEDFIIKARALPCKHMCKAAEVLEEDIFAIFERQIFRRD